MTGSRPEWWKRLLGLFFVLVIVEGALRKWVFPQYDAALYFAKDAVLILAVVGYTRHRRLHLPAAIRGGAFALLLGLYIWIVLMQAVNIRLPSVWVGLLGLKTHALYLLLLVLVPAAFPQAPQRQSRLILGYIAAIAIPVSLLGIYQFFQPPGHWINSYVGETSNISTVGASGHARVTGTFPFISGMTTFLVLNLGMAIGLIWGSTRDQRWYLPGLVLLGITMVVGPMNGSRSFVALPMLAAPFLLYDAMKRPAAGRRAGIAVLIGLAAMAVFGTSQMLQGWQALAERAATAGDAPSRVVDSVIGPWVRAFEAGPLGYGAGSTHQAAPRLVQDEAPYSWLPDIYLEEENGRIAVELGWIGFLVYLGLKGMAVWLAFTVLRRADDPLHRAVGAGGLIFLSAHLIAGVVFNATAAALYWGCLGLVVYARSTQISRQRDTVREPAPVAVPGLRYG